MAGVEIVEVAPRDGFQAVRAFELFTGIQPNMERMKAAFAAFKDKPVE